MTQHTISHTHMIVTYTERSSNGLSGCKADYGQCRYIDQADRPTLDLNLEKCRAKRTISTAMRQRNSNMVLTGIRLKPSACIRSLRIALNTSPK